MNSPGEYGIRIAGVGSAVPANVLTNADFERMVDTSDEWIVQRTGIRERRVIDPAHQGTFTLARDALQRALEDANLDARDLDLIVLGTVTGEMSCPSVACRVADALGAAPAGAFDVVAACSGFVYSINIADALIRSGRYRTVGVIGADAMSSVIDYTDRNLSILFGDAAGAAVVARDDDPSLGCLHQMMQADAKLWESLYIPRREQDIPERDRDNPVRLGCLRMRGREIFKFAVPKMREAIEQSLEASGLDACQIRRFICHQSNLRILNSVREKLNLEPEKFYINIDKYGNSSAGSVGLCFDQLWRAGKVKRGDYVMFVAIGGGLTWATSVWKL